MESIGQVYTKVKSDYGKNINKKLMMIDALAIYCVATGLIQLAYMILVGNFPFNSFLSSFICHVGIFACAVSLRLQLTSTSEFTDISPEKSFGDFTFCVLVLLFVVYSFLG
ncbi:DAD/Ost2 [Ochromonadaceae sp. CCMP2298]|nr:DAD/Ost2 [Ochromonadaceae sp. CCMP2298]